MRTVTWDVIAWNRAAAVVLTDYGRLPVEQRNILRLVFLQPAGPRTAGGVAGRGTLRRRVVPHRRGARGRGCRDRAARRRTERGASPEFASLWRDNDVQSHGGGEKRLRHPVAGWLTLEYSAFAVDGRPDLSLIVYNPATPADRKRIDGLLDAVPAHRAPRT